ncbi:hypothetical protein GcM1_219046 [Golovinomyces cichoracearum]|uniref:RING-type domain-containing protein n=1 Tax=Golovinomyces cichoracearum TaxID=62708 RepID=A0A420ISE4_9PEZI|nr:hypothetical protein GcM1_219046 [Golovinomyces cichoracearum]
MENAPHETQENSTVNHSLHHCQHVQSSPHTLSSSMRENQHYDPVHESRQWYQNTAYATNQYSHTHQLSQPSGWTLPPFVAFQNTYHHTSREIHGPTSLSQVLDSRRPIRTSFDRLRNQQHDYTNQFNNQMRESTLESTAMGSNQLPTGFVNLDPVGPNYLSPLSLRNRNLAITTTRQPQENITTVEQNVQNRYPTQSRLEPRNSVSYPREINMRLPPEARSGFQIGFTRPSRRNRSHFNSSDEEDEMATNYEYMLLQRRFAFGSNSDEERSIAAMRGALASGQRITSKAALASLETLKPEELDKHDRACVICYNEFGVKNPEGISEIPLRLPKCKHIFGDKCIKKWLEDSDSCPYCRDKLPSEVSLKKMGTIGTFNLSQGRINAFGQGVGQEDVATRYLSTVGAIQPIQVSGNTHVEGHSTAGQAQVQTNRDIQWPSVPVSRASASDPHERRRQFRNRVDNTRYVHPVSRQMSIRSTRMTHLSSSISPNQRLDPRLSINMGSNLLDCIPDLSNYTDVPTPTEEQTSTNPAFFPVASQATEPRMSQYSPYGVVSLSAPVGISMSTANHNYLIHQGEARNELQPEIEGVSHSLQSFNSGLNNVFIFHNGPPEYNSYRHIQQRAQSELQSISPIHTSYLQGQNESRAENNNISTPNLLSGSSQDVRSEGYITRLSQSPPQSVS